MLRSHIVRVNLQYKQRGDCPGCVSSLRVPCRRGQNNSHMRKQKVVHYRRRAEELMRLGDFGIDPECMEWAEQIGKSSAFDRSARLCPNAAGLLYVHAGIAMTDAVLVFLMGNRSTAQNHLEAAARLQKECGRRRRPVDGIKHFQWLVQNKDFFAYDDKRVSLDDAKTAQTRIQRFLVWAYRSFPEIAKDDDV